MLKIAIVGAGPPGFNTAEVLAAACPGCEVDLIERLPSPFGLVRYGVAPDHQTTKSIQETFARVASRLNLRFIGNLQIDRDVGLQELMDCCDAVVLACGVPDDAPLDIPGAKCIGVYGAAEFVGWYNAHPDYASLDPDLSHTSAVIVGNGNVAIDCARVLSRPHSDLAKSDIASHALQRLEMSKLVDVTVAGRCGPIEAKFTSVELEELGELEGVVALTEPKQVPAALPDNLPPREKRTKAKNLACFRRYAEASEAAPPRRIRFVFNARPVEILGGERVQAARFERTSGVGGKVVGAGAYFDVSCGLAISAIGYRARSIGGYAVAPSGDRLVNAEGRVAPGLYVAGWLKRGHSGKIGTNRADAEAIADRIRQEVASSGKPGFKRLEPRPAAKCVALDHVCRPEDHRPGGGRGGLFRCAPAEVHDHLRHARLHRQGGCEAPLNCTA